MQLELLDFQREEQCHDDDVWCSKKATIMNVEMVWNKDF